MIVFPSPVIGRVASLVSTTWNSSDKDAGVTLSGGDLTAAASSDFLNVRSTTSKSSGKFYAELTATSQASGSRYGYANSTASLSSALGSDANSLSVAPNGAVRSGGSVLTNIGAFSAGAVVMLAIDLAAGKGWFGVNGTWNGDPATNSGGFTLPSGAIFLADGPGGGSSQTINFGASSFAYSIPSGFSAWG